MLFIIYVILSSCSRSIGHLGLLVLIRNGVTPESLDISFKANTSIMKPLRLPFHIYLDEAYLYDVSYGDIFMILVFNYLACIPVNLPQALYILGDILDNKFGTI